jgi:hypothetical protein
MASRKSLPHPLTGGGQGVGEVATCRDDGNFPPTLTLPREGGGDRLAKPAGIAKIGRADRGTGRYLLGLPPPSGRKGICVPPPCPASDDFSNCTAPLAPGAAAIVVVIPATTGSCHAV